MLTVRQFGYLCRFVEVLPCDFSAHQCFRHSATSLAWRSFKIHGALFVQSIDEPTLVQFFNDTGIASYGRGRHEDCKRQ